MSKSKIEKLLRSKKKRRSLDLESVSLNSNSGRSLIVRDLSDMISNSSKLSKASKKSHISLKSGLSRRSKSSKQSHISKSSKQSHRSKSSKQSHRSKSSKQSHISRSSKQSRLPKNLHSSLMEPNAESLVPLRSQVDRPQKTTILKEPETKEVVVTPVDEVKVVISSFETNPSFYFSKTEQKKDYKQRLYTEDEILEYLKDTVEVHSIGDLKLHDHICYFTTDSNGNKAFRKGGSIEKIIRPSRYNKNTRIELKNDTGFTWNANWDNMSSCHKICYTDTIQQENTKLRDEVKKLKKNIKELNRDMDSLKEILDSHTKTITFLIGKLTS